jgi:hypothetical protein
MKSVEINIKTKFFFIKTTIFIAEVLIRMGFKKTTAGFKVVDLSRDQKIVLWYFIYPIIK